MRYKFWKLPIFSDTRGALCSIEFKNLPFSPKRTYFLYGTKTKRGGHAHRHEKEVFVCLAGKFRAVIHDGKRKRSFIMKTPGQALYNANMVWHEFDQFSRDAIMLAISSAPFSGKKEYIMVMAQFLVLCRKKS